MDVATRYRRGFGRLQNTAARVEAQANLSLRMRYTSTSVSKLWREKVAQTDPSGEKPPHYIISDRPMTEEKWERERCGNERPMVGCVGLSPVFICVHYRHQTPQWETARGMASTEGAALICHNLEERR